jgi:Uma2 family endonuclease
MTLAAPSSLTLDEFFRQSCIEESPAWEYINGESIQKPMAGGKHSRLQKRLVSTLDQASPDYEAFPELRCTMGDRSVVPDIVVVGINQLPVDENGDILSKGLQFAPPWVIEILSPDQSQTRVTGNILHCIKHGTRLGWLIDPEERSVLLYQPNSLPDLLSGADAIPGLPEINLDLSVEQLFGWLKQIPSNSMTLN